MQGVAQASRPTSTPRAVGAAVAAGLFGLAPLLAGATGGAVLLVVWLALWAFSLGALLSGVGPRVSWLAPVAWSAALALIGAQLATPHFASACVVGLYFAGWGSGRLAPARRIRIATLSLALVSGLFLLPRGFEHEPHFSAATRARLLDLSPVALAVEASGADWLRHPLSYDALDASSIGPDLRRPTRGFLAGPLLLLVGCALAVIGHRASRVA